MGGMSFACWLRNVAFVGLVGCVDSNYRLSSDAATPDPGSSADGSTPTTDATSTSTSDAATAADGSSVTEPGTGPGPLGALPTGYCCTSNEQCRARNCTSVAGSERMCFDDCQGDSTCEGIFSWFSCDDTKGMCRPIVDNNRCVPQVLFTTGTKPMGACCRNTMDATSGTECAGGQCVSFRNGPFFCSQVCGQGAACPAGYHCQRIEAYSLCAPDQASYACTP
jgi:hypothetical protein